MEIQAISDQSNPRLNPGNGGSHVWLHKYFLNNLKEKTFQLEGVALNNALGKLKHLRTDADYGHEDVSRTDLDNAEKHTKKVLEILNKRYINE